MKNLCTLILLAILVNVKAFAVPAYPHPVAYQLPDGTTLTVTLKGDENVHWAMSEDEYTLLINQDGYYEYAMLGENGNLILSGVQARNVDERSGKDMAFLNTVQQDLRYSSEQVYYMLQIYEMRNSMATYMESADDSGQRAMRGQRRFPMVLVGFQGKPFTKTKSEFEMLMNQPNYTAGGITGSVYDYFYACSYQQLEFQVDVFGPYTLDNAIGKYDDECNSGGSYGDPRNMAREAANAAANDGCDFSNYDYNNDGYVDGFHVVFAGYGQESGAPVCQSIWSHAWNINNPPKLNGKYVSRYSCSPELRGLYGSNITHIGVIAHELSHVFGLPDTYDTDYYSSGGYSVDLGGYCMMADGSWNDNGRTPSSHSAWCRNELGWTTLQTLSASADITIPNPQTQSVMYRVNTNTNNEYFLIENRQKAGWDQYIPASGMIIYHVDRSTTSPWNNNCINCNPNHRYYYIKQSGCTNGNSNCSNHNLDPYPYGANNSFTDTSTPNSKSWAGANTNKPITNITHNTSNKTVSFTFMGGSGASSNANLAILTVNHGTLSPTFTPNTTNYTVNVENTVATITITGVTEDANATVTGNVTNAPLNVGSNKFTLTVTAENATTKNYIVTVTRSTPQYTITASVSGNTGGTISPEGAVSVNEGESITFEMTADENYTIACVFVDLENIGTNNIHTFSNVTENHTIMVKFEKSTAVEDVRANNDSPIRVYPNPTMGLITICDMRCATSDIEIFDIIGRAVLVETHGRASLQAETGQSQITFDLSNVPVGIYFLRITTADGVIVRKVVKSEP